MTIVKTLTQALGNAVVTGADMAKWTHDWTGKYTWTPLAVVRPANTREVSEAVKLCAQAGVAVVPVGGNTGLTGATTAEGAIMISLDRMNTVRQIKPDAQVALVEAGCILDSVHSAVADHELMFPLYFGARGSATVGGVLSTNAGGSNVLRYGNTRDLCLGLEVVLPDGRILDLMSELRKDNSGYNLKHLFIGGEGTLGLITAAVLKLVPAPKARATAMLGLSDLDQALRVLNRMQTATGGGVEAFEYMPRTYIERHMKHFPKGREPLEGAHAVNILLEVASTRPKDAEIGPDGTQTLTEEVQNALVAAMEDGLIDDAVLATNEAQRDEMWQRRESAAELTFDGRKFIDADISLPLDAVPGFLPKARAAVLALDPGADILAIAHLGDGNIHHTIYPTTYSDAIREEHLNKLEDLVNAMGGSFSAEHGIGISKLGAMIRQKDATAMDAMRAIKAALDPSGTLNPGKVIPS